MEKLVYVTWKRADDSDEDFARRLRGEVAPALGAAGARSLEVSAVDDAVVAGAGLRLGRMEPAKSGLVTFWLEQSQERGPLETLLHEATGRIAGYLVVESCPLPPPESPVGARAPGFSLVTCIRPRADLAYEEFVRQWYEVQRDTAIQTQDTFAYVRNEIVRALTPEAPPWAAVVEEGFPLAALDDPHAFYDSGGSEERLRAHQKRMFEAVRGFLALDEVESHPMSRYRCGGADENPRRVR